MSLPESATESVGSKAVRASREKRVRNTLKASDFKEIHAVYRFGASALRLVQAARVALDKAAMTAESTGKYRGEIARFRNMYTTLGAIETSLADYGEDFDLKRERVRIHRADGYTDFLSLLAEETAEPDPPMPEEVADDVHSS